VHETYMAGDYVRILGVLPPVTVQHVEQFSTAGKMTILPDVFIQMYNSIIFAHCTVSQTQPERETSDTVIMFTLCLDKKEEELLGFYITLKIISLIGQQ